MIPNAPQPAGDAMRCGARTRYGGHCLSWPVRGATRCRMHGGSLPQVRRAAARRLEAERIEKLVRREVARLGGRLDLDPIDALLAVVAGASADVAALEVMVAALEPHELGTPKGDALTRLLRDARKEARQASKAALDAGVDERRVRVSEATTARLASVMFGALEDCAAVLAPEALLAVRAAMARRIRGLGPGAGALEAGTADR